MPVTCSRCRAGNLPRVTVFLFYSELRDHEGLRRSMSRLSKDIVGVSSVHKIMMRNCGHDTFNDIRACSCGRFQHL
jgi:hypothetical protein